MLGWLKRLLLRKTKYVSGCTHAYRAAERIYPGRMVYIDSDGEARVSRDSKDEPRLFIGIAAHAMKDGDIMEYSTCGNTKDIIIGMGDIVIQDGL